MASRITKAKQLRDKTLNELRDHILKLERDLFDLRFKHGTRQLEDTSDILRTRRELARTITVIGEMTRAQATEANAQR